MFWATVFIALLIGSCGQSNKNAEKEPEEISNANEFEKRIAEIDNNPDLLVIKSLSYNDNAGNTVEARAFLNKDQEEVRIEEDFGCQNGKLWDEYFLCAQRKKIRHPRSIFGQAKK